LRRHAVIILELRSALRLKWPSTGGLRGDLNHACAIAVDTSIVRVTAVDGRFSRTTDMVTPPAGARRRIACARQRRLVVLGLVSRGAEMRALAA
jgi:hypothetical protein